MDNFTPENEKREEVYTNIDSSMQEDQDVDITMDEIEGQKNTSEEVSPAKLKADIDKINPDVGTLDRG